MSDPSSDAAVDESDACCGVFLEWLAANGADTSLLEWPCFTWPGLPHDGVRGVAAGVVGEIERGEAADSGGVEDELARLGHRRDRHGRCVCA